MPSLRAFLRKHRPLALKELEDTLAIAEAKVPPNVLSTRDTNSHKTRKVGNARKLLGVLNQMCGTKTLPTVIGELKRAMAEQKVKTLDALPERLRFSGCVRMKEYNEDLNSVKLPREWTMEHRQSAIEFIMYRPMGKSDICLYEWVLSKHPGVVPSLTDALATIVKGFGACVDQMDCKNTHFDLLCEVKRHLFETLGDETPYVRRIPSVAELKIVERCLEADLRSKKVVGGIPCSVATIGLLTEIMLGFTGRTEDKDQKLLASICGGKVKAQRLWDTVKLMKDVGAAADCPWIDSSDYEILMHEDAIVDYFIDSEDDFDRYTVLRGLFGVIAMHQSTVTELKNNISQHRDLGKRDEDALTAVAVSLGIKESFTSPLYCIFLSLMGRSFVKDRGVAAQSISAAHRAKRRKRERSNTISTGEGLLAAR